MNVAGRLAVAVEVTGEQEFNSAMSKLEAAGKKTQAAVQTHLSVVQKSMGEVANAAALVGKSAEKGSNEASAAVAKYAREATQAAGSLAAFGTTAQRTGQQVGRFGSEVDRARSDLGQFVAGTTQASHGIGRFEQSIAGASRSMAGFVGGLGALYTAQRAAFGFVSMADEASRLEGRLRLVTGSSGELARVQEQLFAVSQRTRSEYASNVELYTRSTTALSALGATSSDVVRFTEALNQAFAISGASTAEQSSAIIQLSQALASGTLRGEEFNSVNEAAPRIMKALADAIGVPVGQMRSLAENGRLTAQVLKDGILSQAPVLAAEFAKIPRTVSGAMVQLNNDTLRAVEGVNRATSATATLANEVDRVRGIVSSSSFGTGLTMIVRGIGTDIQNVNDIFRDIQAVSAWGDTIQQEATEVRAAVSDAATTLYTAWKTNYDANLALIGPWVEAWTLGALKVQDANSAAAANAGLSWKGFVDASIDEIATLIAATKALGGIGSDLGIAGTFKAEFEDAREMLRGFANEAGAGASVVLDTVVVSENAAATARRAHIEAIKDEGMALPGLTAAADAAIGPTVKLAESTDKAEKAALRHQKAIASQREAMDEQVAGLRLQIETMGMSEGKASAMPFHAIDIQTAQRIAGKDAAL